MSHNIDGTTPTREHPRTAHCPRARVLPPPPFPRPQTADWGHGWSAVRHRQRHVTQSRREG
eukprot:scaffold308701_cov21-Tisochrysis_lutea.AAC.1